MTVLNGLLTKEQQLRAVSLKRSFNFKSWNSLPPERQDCYVIYQLLQKSENGRFHYWETTIPPVKTTTLDLSVNGIPIPKQPNCRVYVAFDKDGLLPMLDTRTGLVEAWLNADFRALGVKMAAGKGDAHIAIHTLKTDGWEKCYIPVKREDAKAEGAANADNQ